MLENAFWITTPCDFDTVCPTFIRRFSCPEKVQKATLTITAVGVYEARIGQKRVGQFVLAPGWTSYKKRHQVQTYDVTELLASENQLEVTVARGWYLGRLAWSDRKYLPAELSLICSLDILYTDGRQETILSDDQWTVKKSPLRFCEIYDGELYDATCENEPEMPVALLPDVSKDNLIEQEGEEVREQLHVKPLSILTTPKGEKVIDFGQEMTGYVKFRVKAHAGDRVVLSFFEILDKDGNVYKENYRNAQARLEYICRDGEQEYKTTHTFYGFRRVQILEFPEEISLDQIEAIAVHSNIRRTGYLESSHPLLNQLFHNIIWGQRGNFLDIPTDCPQRDERLGWTGDAQVFCRTATYNFDTEKFFKKWLSDMRADQWEDGGIPHVIPFILEDKHCSAAWGDAGVVVPWQVYLTYGDKKVLEVQYDSMKKWVGYIQKHSREEFLWTGCEHFGDWCALDLGRETVESGTRKDFIASVYYAHAVQLVIKAGKVLGADVSEQEALYPKIVSKINEVFPTYHTQCEHTLALYFDITKNKQETAAGLAKLVTENGNRLDTGFVGTPYLLHALSDNGYTELAYTLLLQEKYPSWLFSVKQGATTIWEHWDGIREDGSVWSAGMNSYNHYAYGAVADWVYGVAAGIQTVEEAPGFAKAVIAPHPDKRLGWLKASLETRHGKISSHWYAFEGGWRYEIETPVDTTLILDGKKIEIGPGSYLF
jgi:alpha-L-rhamnosidase